MSGASEASTGAAPPVDASANAPDSSPCPLPSYRQFVQEALAGIIKVGDHAEPVVAYRSSDSHRSSLPSSPRGAGVPLRRARTNCAPHQSSGGGGLTTSSAPKPGSGDPSETSRSSHRARCHRAAPVTLAHQRDDPIRDLRQQPAADKRLRARLVRAANAHVLPWDASRSAVLTGAADTWRPPPLLGGQSAHSQTRGDRTDEQSRLPSGRKGVESPRDLNADVVTFGPRRGIQELEGATARLRRPLGGQRRRC